MAGAYGSPLNTFEKSFMGGGGYAAQERGIAQEEADRQRALEDLQMQQIMAQTRNVVGSSAGSAGGTTRGGGATAGGNAIGGGGAGAPLQSMSEQQRYDPWSLYRQSAGTQLAQQNAQDPSGFYSGKLQEMSSPGSQFTTNDPSYDWRFQQGQQALERSQGSRGLLNSGTAAIELQQYGQHAASQEYDAQFKRMISGLGATSSAYDTQMQRLMQMAGIGANPVAGGSLNVAQQETANKFALGQQAAQNANMTDWSRIFNTGA